MFKRQIDQVKYYAEIQSACEEFKQLSKDVIEGVVQIALDNNYTFEQARYALSQIINKFTFTQLLFLFNCDAEGCIRASELFRILNDYGVEITMKQAEHVFLLMKIEKMDLKAFETYVQEYFDSIGK